MPKLDKNPRITQNTLAIFAKHHLSSIMIFPSQMSDDTSSRHAVDQDKQEHVVFLVNNLVLHCVVQRTNSCCGFFDLSSVQCTVLV